MKKLIVFVAFILFISTYSYASPLAKESWFQYMSEQLPKAICNASAINNCENLAMLATKICLEQHWDQVPDTMNMPNDGTVFGAKVGTCTEKVLRVVIQF